MNKERMMELADFIEKLEHIKYKDFGALRSVRDPDQKIVFSMLRWSDPYDCGTVCCIGGSGEQLLGGYIQDKLGISWDEKEALCYPCTNQNWNKITPQIAAQTLRLIANEVLDMDETLWPNALELLGEQELSENKYKN